MLDLALAATVLLLCHLGRTGTGTPVPTRVDRIELNHYTWTAGCQSHQVIIWRWSGLERRYRPERYFFVAADGSDAPYRIGGYWRFRHRDTWNRRPDRVFESDDFIETVTDYDPWKQATHEGSLSE